MAPGIPTQCCDRVPAALIASLVFCFDARPAWPQEKTAVRQLTEQEIVQVRRHLFPLPQDLRFEGSAVSIAPQACTLDVDPGLTDLGQRFVSGFRQRWKNRFGTELRTGRPRADGLRIVLGRTETFGPLREAATGGWLDLRHLATRPSADQAYCISVAASPKGAVVYLAAKDSPGLYYAMITFEQLLEGLDGKTAVTAPAVRIVDWPDIPCRGIWKSGWIEFANIGERDPTHVYSRMKLNEYTGYMIWFQVSKDQQKRIWIDFDRARARMAQDRPNNVRCVPFVIHFGNLVTKLSRHFPEIHAKATKEGDKPPRCWCYGNPKSQEVMDRMFEAIARDARVDRLAVWLNEGIQACGCPVCQGDLRRQFVGEVRHVLHALDKARAIRPGITISLWFSQGTYDYNLDLLDLIPKDIAVMYYDGSRTYNADLSTYMLPPSVVEMVRRGYRVGVVPVLKASCGTAGNCLFPFWAPSLAKLRMSEYRDRGVENMCAWMPPFVVDFSLEAMAEYAWNASGRSTREFAAAWATRQGMTDPELAADIVGLLEYPALALVKATHARSPQNGIKRMITMLRGEKPYWSAYWAIEGGFEQRTHAELARVLRRCDEAVVLAEKLDDEEFAAGARLLRHWIAIVERFTLFLEQPGTDTDAAVGAKGDIARLGRELPDRWRKWFVLQPFDDKTRASMERWMERVQKDFGRLNAR